MRKVIAAMNITIDGFCDHTAGIPDEELHKHYADLLSNAGVILYGRTTYQLMQYWQDVLKNPADEPSTNDFARAIDKIPKVVFSHQLSDTGWDSAELATRSIEETISELKQQPGNDILIGSPSLIAQLTNLDLIDEYQLGVHPVIVGKGLSLFENLKERTVFKLLNTKVFTSGIILLCYSKK